MSTLRAMEDRDHRADWNRPQRVQIHDRGDRQIGGILRLIEEAGRQLPLGDVLDSMCREVAAIAHADIVSVYVREQSDGAPHFVMRGNVGFPRDAVGRVKLHLGEGITGFAAECMRPVSADMAERDAHYKHVPELGEESFPAFLAVPLVSSGTAEGVLVLQRRDSLAFSDAEVALATALATTFGLALERAKVRAGERVAESPSSGRSARLTGTALVGGHALGRLVVMPTFEALPSSPTSGGNAKAEVEQALGNVVRSIAKAFRKLEADIPAEARRELASLMLVLDDERLRNLIRTQCDNLGIVRGLRVVAREYAAAPYRAGATDDLESAWAARRAREVEDLCLMIAASAVGQALVTPGSALMVADHVGAFTMLGLCVQRACAIATGGEVEAGDLGVVIARAASIPVVAEVAGLFAWARPDDTILIDGDNGVVRVNPSVNVIAKYRHDRA